MLDEQNIKEKTNISLTPAEKKEIKDNVLFFMRTHPQGSVQPSPFYKDSLLLWSSTAWFATGKFVVAAAVILLVGGGALAAGAQDSLPKDTLYPFKININEKVLGWFAQGDAAEAKFETTLATERLKEAEKLAVRGDLDEKTALEAEASFSAHADKARNAAKNLETHDTEGAFAVNASLDSSLDAHGTILSRVFGDKSGTATENIKISVNSRKQNQEGRNRGAVSLMSSAKVAAPENETMGVNDEAVDPDTGSEKSALSARDYALTRLKKAHDRYDRKKSTLDTENQAEIESHFDEAGEFNDLASTASDAGDYDEAVANYKMAANEADYIYIILQAKDDLKVDIISGFSFNKNDDVDTGEANTDIESEKPNDVVEVQQFTTPIKKDGKKTSQSQDQEAEAEVEDR